MWFRYVVKALILVTYNNKNNLHCVQKKRNQNVFHNISYKTGWCWRNLVHRVLNKVATKWHKRFPPQSNSVSTLPHETWNAHRIRATTELVQKKLQNLSRPNCGLHLCQICYQFITACRKYCKNVQAYKTSTTDLELSTMPLINGCCNDDMIQLGPLRSQSLFQFVRSLMCILYTINLLLQ